MSSPGRSDRRRGGALLTAWVIVLLLSTPVAARSRGTVLVAVHDGVITLEAVDAAWPEVVRELARETGMVIHVPALPEEPISASFIRVDPTQVVRRLFGANAGFAFVYGTGPVPAEVWVASVATPSSGDFTVYGSTPVALNSELRQADPRLRANEADRLASEDGVRAVDVLARVMVADPDPGVRSAAARGLIRIGTPAALDAARHAIFDAAKLVRLQAVEAFADDGGEQARSVLREAMRDEEEEVRDAAAAGIPDADGPNVRHRADLERSR